MERCIRDVDLDLQHLLQPSSYRNDLSFYQAIRDLKCTHAGRRVLWRLLEVRSEHASLPTAEPNPLQMTPTGKSPGPLSTAQANVHPDSQSRRLAPSLSVLRITGTSRSEHCNACGASLPPFQQHSAHTNSKTGDALRCFRPAQLVMDFLDLVEP